MTADFTPEARKYLVDLWTVTASEALEARLPRVLAEQLSSAIRRRRNMLERCTPMEAGVRALELAAIGEVVQSLDAAFARRLVHVATRTCDTCDVFLEVDRATLARGGAS